MAPTDPRTRVTSAPAAPAAGRRRMPGPRPLRLPAHGPRTLGLLALAAATLLAARSATAIPRISAEGIHLPTVTNFCGDDQALVEVTICNTHDATRTFEIDLFDGGTPPAYPCTESTIPDHVFLDPEPAVVGPGACRTFRILVDRPDALDVHASVCYWVRLRPDTGGTVALGGQLIDAVVSCIDWAFEEAVIFLDPLDPVVRLDPSITNHSSELVVFDYLIEVRDGAGATEQTAVALNGAVPPDPVMGSVDIPAGETAVLELSAEWLEPDATGIFDVVILGDVPGPGRALPPDLTVTGAGDARRAVGELASIGLALRPPVVSVNDVPPGVALRPPLRVAPNPWRDGGPVTIGFASPHVWTSAHVFDTAGRALRHLRASSAAPVEHIAWDGHDDAGSPVPPGVYYVRLRTGVGVRQAKVVRLP